MTQAVRQPSAYRGRGTRSLCELPQTNAVIATGPLTSDRLAEKIAALPGLETLNFCGAAAPIVSGESLDMAKVFRQGRYGRGDDYLNCPMNREEYEAFYHALLTAEKAEVHGFDGTQVFEGCMPIEVMAARGEMMPCAYRPDEARRARRSANRARTLRRCAAARGKRSGDHL